MKITNRQSDEAILTELGRRLRRQRLDLNRTQAALAHEAGVSKRTVERLEAGGSTQLDSFVRVLRALGLLAQADALVPEVADSPLRTKRRERARTVEAPAQAEAPWTWADD